MNANDWIVYAIALIAPLATFVPFLIAIKRDAQRKVRIFADQEKAILLFVTVPLLVSYGLIGLIATYQFVDFILDQ